jgi:hypothetical protein
MAAASLLLFRRILLMLPVFIFFIVERGELKACYLAVLLFAVLLLPTKTVGEPEEISFLQATAV